MIKGSSVFLYDIRDHFHGFACLHLDYLHLGSELQFLCLWKKSLVSLYVHTAQGEERSGSWSIRVDIGRYLRCSIQLLQSYMNHCRIDLKQTYSFSTHRTFRKSNCRMQTFLVSFTEAQVKSEMFIGIEFWNLITEYKGPLRPWWVPELPASTCPAAEIFWRCWRRVSAIDP